MEIADESLKKFLNTWDGSGDVIDEYNKYIKNANSATSAFSATLKSVAANMAIMLAINTAIKIATKLWDNFNTTVAEVQSDLDETQSTISSLKTQIEELEKIDANVLTQGQKDKLENLKEQLKVQEQLEEIEKRRLARETLGTGNFADYFDKDSYKNAYVGIMKDLTKYQGDIDGIAPLYEKRAEKTKRLSTLVDAGLETGTDVTGLQESLRKAEEKQDKTRQDILKLQESLISSKADIQEWINTIEGFISDGFLVGEDLNEANKNLQELYGGLQYVNNELQRTNTLLYGGDDSWENVLAEKTKYSLKNLEDYGFSEDELKILSTLEFDKNASISELRDILDETQKVASENPVETGISFDYQSFTDGISEISSAYDTLSSAIEEYNANGAYSLDTVNKLLGLKPEYLALLVNESGQLAINEQGLRNIVQAQLEKAQAEIYATGIAKIKALADKEAGEAATQASTDMQNSVEGINAQTEALNQNTFAEIANNVAKEAGVTDQSSVDSIIAETENQVKALQSAVQGLTFDVGGVTGGFKSMGSAAKSASKSTDALTESMKKQKEALESTKSELEKQKQYYEDVAEAIDWFYDKQIEKQEKAIDSLEKENELLEERIDYYDGALSAIDRYYEKQIEKLEEQKDALAGNNKEEEIALNLEKRRQELLEARSRKTILQYESGKGFSYTTDNSAIKTAEENLADAQRQKEEADIDAKIDKLKEYQALWAEIPSAKQKAEEESQMIEILGANWESILLEGRIQNITSFKEQYIAIQEQIDSNESLIASYEEKIEYYEALKTEWDNLLAKYTEDTYIQLLVGAFGNDYENELLNGRTLRWEQFAEDYYNIQVQLKEVTDQIETLAKRMEEYASRIESAANSAMDAVDNLANVTIPSVPTVNKGRGASPSNGGGGNKYVASVKAKGGIITKKDAGDFDFIANALKEDHMIGIQEGEAVIPKETVAKNPEAIDSLLSGKELDLKSIVYREGVLKETTPMGIYSLLEKYQDWITPESAIMSRLNLPSQDFSKLGVVNNNDNSTVIEINGDLSFPNIQSRNDAKLIIDDLKNMSNKARQRASRRY